MTNLDMLKYLIDDTQKELNKDDEYHKALKEAKQKVEDANNIFNYWEYMPKGLTGTNKQRIKDNLKMLRRISLEVEKEL